MDPGLLDNSYNVVLVTNATDVVLDRIVVAGGCADVDPTIVPSLDLDGMVSPREVEDPIAEIGPLTVIPLDRRLFGGGLLVQRTDDQELLDLIEPDVTLYRCDFIGNVARGYGGGVPLSQCRRLFFGVFLSRHQLGCHGRTGGRRLGSAKE